MGRLPVRVGLCGLFALAVGLVGLGVSSCAVLLKPLVDGRASAVLDEDSSGVSASVVPPSDSSAPGPAPGFSRSDFRRGRGGDKDFVRALAATGGPRKVKVTGSGAYAGPGATLAAATGRNAAPVVGDGNRVELAREEVTPFPWWAVVALGVVGGYYLFRNRQTS